MKREGWIWGALLVVSLAAGIIGFAQWRAEGGGEPAPPALRLDDPLPQGEAPPVPDLPPGFVPDLPAVPTLPAGTHVGGARDPEASADDELAGEMRLVSEARRMLEEDPAGALSLLDQHRTRFPQGALREEREAYAIEAMIALEHTAEVERRYLEFRHDFPTSAFLPRLAQLMR